MRRSIVGLFCVFALACGDPAAAAVPGAVTVTADAVLAHVRAASGSVPHAYREVVDATESGSVTRIVTVRAGDDVRETFDQGPLHAERGTVGGQAWSQNDNGETVLERLPEDSGTDAAAPASREIALLMRTRVWRRAGTGKSTNTVTASGAGCWGMDSTSRSTTWASRNSNCCRRSTKPWRPTSWPADTTQRICYDC